MKFNLKNKIIFSFLILACAAEGFNLFFNFSDAQVAGSFSPKQIEMAAYIVNSENKEITNGEYDVQFAIYSIDRSSANAAEGISLWRETQKVSIENGILKSYLGSVTPIPDSINFGGAQYYLGIKIGTDSEMVPRKKMSAVPLAINALSAQNAQTIAGAVIGTGSGNILALGAGGKVNIKQLPTGTSGKKLLLAEDAPSAEVTIAGDYDYVTADGEELTLEQIDLTTDITGKLPVANGGTNISSYTVGDILYASAAGTLSKLNVGAVGEVLTITGGLPSWESPGAAGLIDGGGAANEIAYWTDANTLTHEVQLDETRGGTGISSYVAGDMLYASGVNTLAKLGISSDGRYLRIVGGIPTWVDSPGATSHNLISTAHSDTNPAADVPVAGDMLYRTGGQWRRFAIGDPNDILRVNAGGNAIEWDPTTDITSLGTITTGIWNGTAIDETHGGTGLTTINQGGILYADANDSLAALQGVVGNDNEYLRFHWNGGAPYVAWETATGSFTSFDVSADAGADQTIGDSDVLHILGGSNISTTTAVGSDTVTINFSGPLSVANGGTGVATFGGANTLLYTTAADTLSSVTAGTEAQMLIASDTGVPTFRTLSGDVTVGYTGTTTIGANAVELNTNTTGNYVASITNGNGITGGNGGSEGAALTLALTALSSDWTQSGAFDIALANAGSELKIMESSGATFYGIFDVTDLSADRTYTFPNQSGTVALASDIHSAITMSGAYDYITLAGQDIVRGQVVLTTDVSGILPVANGGTGLATFGGANTLLYTTAADTLASVTAGTEAQMLIASDTGVPTFRTLSGDVTVGYTGTTTIGANAVGSSKVADGSIQEVDLEVTNDPTGLDNYILSLDEATGGFTWIANTGGSGESKWSASSGFTYLTDTADDIVLGSDGTANAPFWFDIDDAGQSNTQSITFEGSTDDGYETKFVITDPTEDRTIVFPNGSGTLVFSGGAGSSLWTNDGTITYLTETGDDMVVGGSDLSSPLSVDVSANTVRIGDATAAGSAILNMYASDGNTGSITYNTNDSWIFEGGNVGLGDTSPLSLFTVGNGDLFQVNSSGVIAAAAGITSSGTITFSGLSTGLVHSNGSGVLTSSAVNLASGDVTGTLPVNRGGTGLATFGGANTLLYTTAADTLASVTAGDDAEILVSVSGVPTFVEMGGDVHIIANGTTAIQADAVGSAEIADNSIAEADLLINNAPTDTYILSYDQPTGGFEWILNDGGSGTSKWITGSGYTYLSNTSNDLVLGSAGTTNAKFLFDVSDSSIFFEGATDDNYETKFVITDPTLSDKTITFKDASGTVAFTSDLHNAITLTNSPGTYDYLTLSGQDITLAQINLTTDVTGILPAANGGTGLNTGSSTGVATVSSGTWTIASSLGVTLGGTGVTSEGDLENKIEAYIFDADTETISGVWTLADNVNFNIGTSGDFQLTYDETTDDRLEIYDSGGTNVMAALADAGSVGNLYVSGGISTYDSTVSAGYGEFTGLCLGNGASCITSWSTGTVDGSGDTGYVAFWTDANSLSGEAQLATSRGGTNANSAAWNGIATITNGVWGETGTAEQGAILYYSDSAWTELNHGTAGQLLQTGGHAANPSWQDAPVGYSGWTIQDGDTTSYAIGSSETVQLTGGTGITSNFSAENILDLAFDSTEIKSVTWGDNSDADIVWTFNALSNDGTFGYYEDENAFALASSSFGIGTTAPDNTLEINAAAGGVMRLTYNDANGSATDYSTLGVGASGLTTLTTVDSDGALGHIALMPDGNVGIGTASPTEKLMIAGNIAASASSTYNLGTTAMDTTADTTFSGAADSDYLGNSVASAGDVNGDGYNDVIVGAPLADAGGTNKGQAYIYYGGPSMDNTADVTFSGGADNDWLGWSVASAGDVNGDGYTDVIVGAYKADAGGADKGQAYIYYGGPLMDNTADVTFSGGADGDQLGISVSLAGDVNGDGYADVIVGATGAGSGNGQAYIYYGGPSMDNTADVTFTGGAFLDNLGTSVSSAGDVNGDGYADVIVGVLYGSSFRGQAYIYYGGPSMDNTADVTFTGTSMGDYLGSSVSSAGDVNGDGYADVIVGAYGFSANGNKGRAYIYYGGPSMDSTADVTFTGGSNGDYLGYSVSSAGDVNGDGYNDVIVGAEYTHAGGTDKGQAYIYYGGASMDNTADVTFTGAANSDFLGNSVASAGDVNGDGYADVIVGANYANAGGTDKGQAYIYTGTGNQWQSVFAQNLNASRGLKIDGLSMDRYGLTNTAMWGITTPNWEIDRVGSASFQGLNVGSFAVDSSGNVTGGTYNGNTITTGTGTLTLSSYTLALTGSADLNQNLLTTSAPTFATIDTGQGANELYDMDQNVLTSSSPTFAGLTLSGLTQGSVPFIGAAGVISQNNSKLFWDDSNYRLGIGTATPSSMLELYGTDNQIKLSYDGTYSASISSLNNGDLQMVSSNTSEAAIVIGTSAAQDTSIQFDGSSSDYYLGVDDTDSKLKIGTGLSVGSSVLAAITSAGDVGIGTDSPTHKLQITDTSVTASRAGLYIAQSGAITGTGYGLYAAKTGASTTNIGGYFSSTGATTSYGVQIAALTSATSRGIDIGALSGTTADIGINIGNISGTGATGSGITIGNFTNTGTTQSGISIGTLSGTHASGGGLTYGLNIGNISSAGATSTNYGINLGTLTGGTTANYQINTGVLTSATTTTNAQLNLGGVVTTGGTTNYGINLGALSGTGTNNYGINITAPTSTGTATYGMKIGGPTGAATSNYGLNVVQPTGATHDAALVIGDVATTAGDWALYSSSAADSYFAGNVGIGDTTPNSLLDLLSSAAADTNIKITNTNAGDYDTAIQFELIEGTPSFTMGVDNSDTNKFKISTTALGTQDRFIIDSNGSVGIGDSSPDANLDIYSAGGDTVLKLTHVYTGRDQDTIIQFEGTVENTVNYTMGMDDSDADKFKISTTALGTNDRFVIDTSGNIGIGTSAPDNTLEINAAAGGVMRLTYNDANGSATDYSTLGVGASGLTTLTTVDSDGALGHIALMPDGNVGIGTASPTEKLMVAGNIAASASSTYNLGTTAMDTTADTTFSGAAESDYLGWSVSSAGDVNGDGYNDVIVGAPNVNGAGADRGQAYIYYGGPSMDNTADVTLTGAADYDYLGYSVSSAGDINGDGYADVIVGAPQNAMGSPGNGKAYIYYGGSSMDSTADITFSGGTSLDNFGISVSSAGDVNGDGYNDVIVGATQAYMGTTETGKAYIYYGGASMDNTADVTFSGATTEDFLGVSVSSAGDINGDGYADVIVGANGADAGGTDKGQAYIYYGGSSMNNTADVTFSGATDYDYLGWSVSSAGDVNGDGYNDVIVGALYADAGGTDKGQAYIYYGGASMDNTADVTFSGGTNNDGLGYSVSSAGDVNGDGYNDVIVGAYLANADGTDKGQAYIYYGGSSMNNTADVTFSGEISNDYLGYSVSSAGDVNGDGYNDVIVGAYGVNIGNNADNGQAYIYTGTGNQWQSVFAQNLNASRGLKIDGLSMDRYGLTNTAMWGITTPNWEIDRVGSASFQGLNVGSFAVDSSGLITAPTTNTINGVDIATGSNLYLDTSAIGLAADTDLIGLASAAVTINGDLKVIDDKLIQIGTSADGVILNRSTALDANTALTGVFVGTPVVGAIGANSTIFSNITTDADMVFAVSDGGNSTELLRLDASESTIAMGTGDTALTIDTNGLVGIGDTTPSWFLDVYGDVATNYVASFTNDGNNANRYGIQIQAGADDASGTTYYINALDGDGGQVGYIANTSGTFALTDVSDISTKTNIADTNILGLDIINGLHVVNFNRLQNPDGPIIRGFIAQEVQEVYPDAITIGPDGKLGLMKEQFIPVIVKAVQELSETSDIQQTNISETNMTIQNLLLKTDSSVTTLGEFQTSVDEQLNIIGASIDSINSKNADNDLRFTNYDLRLTDLEAKLAANEVKLTNLEEEMALIKDQNQAVIDFATALNMESLIYKDALGNIDLGEGKLESAGIVAGAMTIKVVDPKAKTIGEATIKKIKTDEDLDGFDDSDITIDGKSAKVSTKAVTATAKIFVTPKGNAGSVWVEKNFDLKSEEYTGFTIYTVSPVKDNVSVDWFIVEEKD